MPKTKTNTLSDRDWDNLVRLAAGYLPMTGGERLSLGGADQHRMGDDDVVETTDRSGQPPLPATSNRRTVLSGVPVQHHLRVRIILRSQASFPAASTAVDPFRILLDRPVDAATGPVGNITNRPVDHQIFMPVGEMMEQVADGMHRQPSELLGAGGTDPPQLLKRGQ